MKINKVNRCLFALSTILFSIYHSSPASAITIDEFESSHIVTDPPTFLPVYSHITDSKAIGGTRSIRANRTSGGNGMTLKVENNNLFHSQDTGVVGRSIIIWDGDISSNDVNVLPNKVNGLNKLNLKQDNATKFNIEIVSYDHDFTIKMLVYDGNDTSGGIYSIITKTVTLANPPANLVLQLPFEDFVQGDTSSAKANFNQVGSIVLVIEGGTDLDLSLSRIATNGDCDTLPQDGTVLSPCGKCINDPNPNSCVDCVGTVNGNVKPGGPCDTGDVGVCADGTYESQITYIINQQNCTCKAKTTPSPEICDGLDNDCDGQVEDGIIDVCGICGGDGKSCLDCASVPFGSGKADACGVCNGDGKSCADCAGTPNGSAVKDKCGVCNGDNTSCLDCTEIDLSDKQFLMDHGAKLHEKLIDKMLKALTTLDKSASTKSYAKTVAAKAHELQLRNWVISWTFVSKIQICGNTTLCTQVSNTSNVTEYKAHSVELRDIAKQVAAKLKKFKYNTKKFLKDNDNLHKTNTALAEEIPKTYSGGCNL